MMTNIDGHICSLLRSDDERVVSVDVDGMEVAFDMGYLRDAGYLDTNDVLTESGFSDLCMDAIDSLEDC